jgi:predicted DNA-binding transcriptional regulator YafY
VLISSQELTAITKPCKRTRRYGISEPSRWILICRRLYEGGTITIRYLMDEFGISHATAKRDQNLIEAHLPTVRDERDLATDPVVIRLLAGPRVQGRHTDGAKHLNRSAAGWSWK